MNSTLNDRIVAFAKAGIVLTSYLKNKAGKATDDLWYPKIDEALYRAESKNSWFTPDNLSFALSEWSHALKKEHLEQWLEAYKIQEAQPKTVAIIAAGNIPLVGFHDVLSVILVGHHALIKISKNDDVLIPLILEIARSFNENLSRHFTFTKERLTDYDAVIATGSDNTSRYFEYYFGKKPHIIRKSRNSIAILTGEETVTEMEALSEDVFRYFGLGCRSVSHLKVPVGFNFDTFFNGMFSKKELVHNPKYVNNYDYNKAVYLMSEFKLLDNEFLIVKEETSSYSSPIASLSYSFYNTLDAMKAEITEQADKLQCVVSSDKTRRIIERGVHVQAPQFVNYGQTQHPQLNDYADGIDTIDFLLTLS
jgi:hypothetical protein